MRTADYEFAGRIHMILDIIVKQRQYFLVMDRRDDTGHQDINDVDSSVLGIDETVGYIEEFVRKKLKLYE